MSKGGSSALSGLVESIGQHKKFAGLLKYSINCIGDLITPPNPDAGRNCKELVECGGLEALVAAAKEHPESADILQSSTNILALCAKDEEMLAIICKSGACQDLLALTMACSDAEDSRNKLLGIMGKMTKTKENLKQLVASGAVTTVTALLKLEIDSGVDIDSLARDMRILSNLVTVDGAIAQLVAGDGVQLCLQLLGRSGESETLALGLLSVLCMAAEDEATIDTIKQSDGVKAIVNTMECHYTSEGLLDAGGKLLASLCSQADVEHAMQILSDSSSSKAERMHAAAIISNLSMDDALIDAIVQRDGVEMLLSLVNLSSDDNLGNVAVRALGRLASTQEGFAQLLKYDGVASILKALNKGAENSETLVSTILTFKALSQAEGGVEAVISSGALAGMLDAVRNAPDDAKAMGVMLSCLDSMIEHADIFAIVNSQENLLMMLGAVTKHPGSSEITKSVASIMRKFCEDENRVKEICTAEGVAAILLCLRNNLGDETTVVDCFNVLSKLVYHAVKLGTDDCITVAKAIQHHPKVARVMELGAYICNFNFDNDMLASLQQTLKKCTRDMKFVDTDESKEAVLTTDTWAAIQCFGLNQPVASNIHGDLFVKDALNFVKMSLALDEESQNSTRDSLLIVAMEAISRLCSASSEFAEKVALAGIAKKLGFFKGEAQGTKLARCAATLLSNIVEQNVDSGAALKAMSDEGCLTTMLAILGANEEDVDLRSACVSAMLAMCKHPDTAQTFVRSVGPKTLMKSGMMEVAIESLQRSDHVVLNAIHFLEATVKLPTLLNAAIDMGALPSLETLINVEGGSLWVEVVDPTTGKIYYYHQETQETSWNKPEGHVTATFLPATKLMNMLATTVDPTKMMSLGGARMIVSTANQLLICYKGENEEKAVFISSLTTLEALATIDAGNVIDCGGIEILNKAVEMFPDDEEVLTACSRVLVKLSKSPKGKIAVLACPALAALLNMMVAHPEMKQLGISVIAALDKCASDKTCLEGMAALTIVPAIQGFLALHDDDEKTSASGDRVLTAVSARNRKSSLTIKDSLALISPGYQERNVKDVICALQELSKKVLSEESARDEICSSEGVNDILEICTNAQTSPNTLKEAVGVLALMSKNEQLVNVLGMGNNIPKLLGAARRHFENRDIVRSIMKLLTKLAVNDVLKKDIIAEGGIAFILETIYKYMDYAPILASCVSTVANLSYNNLEVAKDIVAAKCVPAIEAVMQRHQSSTSLLSRCLVTLSNLMFQNDEHTIIICKACGDEIVHMIRVHGNQPEVLASGLRALGTLVYCEKNIPIIVGEGATKAIIDSMRNCQENEDTLLMAIHCLSNLSAESFAVSEAPNSVGASFHPARHGESTTQVMVNEGAIDILLEMMRDFDYNSALGIACMDVIPNICDSPEFADLALSKGAASSILHLLQQHDWDNEIVAAGFSCLVSICELSLANADDVTITNLMTTEDLKSIVTILEDIDSDEYCDACVSVCELFRLFLSQDEENARILVDCGVMKAMLSVIENNMNVKSYITEAVPVLVSLAHIEIYSQAIAKEGMHIICDALKEHMENCAVLQKLFDLLGTLAFENLNLPIIVQFGGHTAIIDSICAHPHEAAMILSAIHTLENIAMGDAEYCRIALDAGAQDCAEALLEAYADDAEILQACKSTLLTFSAMSAGKLHDSVSTDVTNRRRDVRKKTLSGRGNRTASVINTEEFLTKHRRALLTGLVMRKHHKSHAPQYRLIYITEDFGEVRWKEDNGKKDKGSLALREVQEVIKGATTKPLCRKHLLRSNANPVCSFTIKGRSRDLDLECQTEDERNRWCEMLASLLQFRKDKRLE